MTLTIMAELLQGSDEWLAQRSGLITASVIGNLISSRNLSVGDYSCPDCAAAALAPCVSKVKRAGEVGAPIKGMHPARIAVAATTEAPPVLGVATDDTARGVTVTLAAERITGHVEPVYMNSDMWRGVEDEPLAREKYAEHHAPVTEVGFMLREVDGQRIGYSPDGLVGDDGLIEIKSRRQKKHVLTILADKVPAENMAQLQCGLYVSGRKWIDYVSYSGGMPLWTKRVKPDPRWFDAIQAAVDHFEAEVADITARYNAAVVGLPMTERTPDYAEIRV